MAPGPVAVHTLQHTRKELGWGSPQGGPLPSPGPAFQLMPAVPGFSPENRAHFESHRWPPIWYLKEEDRYLRMQKERAQEEEALRKQHPRSKWCFWRPHRPSPVS